MTNYDLIGKDVKERSQKIVDDLEKKYSPILEPLANKMFDEYEKRLEEEVFCDYPEAKATFYRTRTGTFFEDKSILKFSVD
jgi:uncharacterized lipoprotein YehR (DUF1307 family)